MFLIKESFLKPIILVKNDIEKNSVEIINDITESNQTNLENVIFIFKHKLIIFLKESQLIDH